MSIYRCNKCDLKKDNDIECVYVIEHKEICQDCWDKRVKELK